jgi:hypothetical protein
MSDIIPNSRVGYENTKAECLRLDEVSLEIFGLGGRLPHV